MNFIVYCKSMLCAISVVFTDWVTYFGHRSISLPQTWLLFRRGVLLLPSLLPGLESPQVLRKIKSNAVLSLFWLELGQKKWPHCMLAPATPTISGFKAGEMTQEPSRARGRGHWNHTLRGGRGGQAPFEPQLTGGHPPLKFPPYSLCSPKGGRKTINFLPIFMGLYLTLITSISSASQC